MITNESINQAIDYILQHIEDVTLCEVAEHCHFSKYYFCRLFKAQTGEGVHGFIRRVRLEQSAFRKSISYASMKHPFFHQEEWQVESFEECNRKISVELLPGGTGIFL